MKNFKTIIVALLLGISIFSAFKYFYSLKEKHNLLNALDKIEAQLSGLESEKQNLSQDLQKEKELRQQLNEENTSLRESLKDSESKLVKLNADFLQVQEAVEQLNSEITTLKAENAVLEKQKDDLNKQLSQVIEESDNLKFRFNSITELKKAIRELKIQMRKVGAVIQKRVTGDEIVKGNRGYLIKDGKPTYPVKIKKIEVEVIPAFKNE